MRPLTWVGLLASIFSSVLTGILLSFNVFAVQLKEKFNLNQTQVEIVSSCFMLGLGFAIVGSDIYRRLGSKLTYVISWLLITPFGLLMWISTLYVEFFGTWIVFICIFHLMGACGTIMSHQCSMAIAIHNTPKRHTGKVTGVFAAVTGLGKVYYSLIMTAMNNDVGHFFLFFPVPITVTLIVCFFFHKPRTDLDTETEAITQPTVLIEEQGERTALVEDSGKDRISVLKSGYFHISLWTGVLLHASSLAFMNNLTLIAKTVNLEHPLNTVDVLSVGVTVFRLTFGFLFDTFRSRKAGVFLIIICILTFGGAMIIGMFCLNDVTIYVMTVLASVCAGAIFNLALTVLFAEFGRDHYSFIIGVYFSLLGVITACFQIIVGKTYDQALSNESQYGYFFFTFVMLLSVDAIILVVQVLCYLKFA